MVVVVVAGARWNMPDWGRVVRGVLACVWPVLVAAGPSAVYDTDCDWPSPTEIR